MKNLITLILILSLSIPSKANIHEIFVWNGYMQFLPSSLTVQLGDTIQWLPLDHPTMVHSITSTNIPVGASTFDQVWQAPADTFFQYIPQVVGLYEYECTPHASGGMLGQFEVVDSLNNIIEPDENLLLVYPNPTNNGITLDIEGYNGSINVEVYDLQGRLLETTTNTIISMQEYAKGIYVFKVAYGDRVEQLKVVKD